LELQAFHAFWAREKDFIALGSKTVGWLIDRLSTPYPHDLCERQSKMKISVETP
jgi:hypothetical protein